MPPGKAHEDAIEIIKNSLKDEFNVEDRNFLKDYTFYRLRPDIVFVNPKTERFVVVEVGNTDAEKIGIYLSIKKIEQIRWYTKHSKKAGIGLSGLWFTDDLSKTYIPPKECSLRLSRKRLKDEQDDINLELRKLDLFMDSYVCCSGCGNHIQLKHVQVAEYRNRQYAVCYLCSHKGYFETISSQRQEFYDFIRTKRQVYYERKTVNG